LRVKGKGELAECNEGETGRGLIDGKAIEGDH